MLNLPLSKVNWRADGLSWSDVDFLEAAVRSLGAAIKDEKTKSRGSRKIGEAKIGSTRRSLQTVHNDSCYQLSVTSNPPPSSLEFQRPDEPEVHGDAVRDDILPRADNRSRCCMTWTQMVWVFRGMVQPWRCETGLNTAEIVKDDSRKALTSANANIERTQSGLLRLTQPPPFSLLRFLPMFSSSWIPF
jgi:hypothetical protein